MKNLMSMKKILFLMMTFLFQFSSCQNLATPSDKQVKNAERYFDELEDLLGHDSAKIWGVGLYGPTMFVNADDRMIIANQQNKDSTFKKKGNVFYGFLPDEYNIANTAMSFSEELWTCVNGLCFNNDMERNLLLVHESFHRAQNEIGIQSVMSDNTHLEEVDASVLLKLELMALSRAFQYDEMDYNNEDLINALTIRSIRQNLYPDNNENKYECHEGLAEYTAFKVLFDKNQNDIIMKGILLNKVEKALRSDTYSNSFAYVTGPIYAFILDELSSDWKDEVIAGKTMIDILLKNINVMNYADSENYVRNIIKQYDAERFINEEYNRLLSMKLEDEIYINRFNESDLIYIKNDNVSFTYNPNEKLISYNGMGTIYKTMRLSGDFGTVELNDGVLVTSDWKYFIIPYNVKDKVSCHFDFNENYSINKVSDKRYELKKLM